MSMHTMQVFGVACSDTADSLKKKAWPWSVRFPVICQPNCSRALKGISGDRVKLARESKVCYIWFHYEIRV